MQNTDTAILDEQQIAEIEARAESASPHYVVDWSKGEHALLQASGWRPANEEQPRTIATFDANDGYLDLLFCAEARTDVPALCQTVREAWAEREAAMKVLEPSMPESGLEDACRQLKQAYISENGNCETLEARLAQVEQERDKLRDTFKSLQHCQNKPVCGHCNALLRVTLKEKL